ncbi:MAG: hypothetical protein H8D34_18280 [Chloroflexi bacterium]|nr:hypothetical protein [Chloroflexota bacterium]
MAGQQTIWLGTPGMMVTRLLQAYRNSEWRAFDKIQTFFARPFFNASAIASANAGVNADVIADIYASVIASVKNVTMPGEHLVLANR